VKTLNTIKTQASNTVLLQYGDRKQYGESMWYC